MLERKTWKANETERNEMELLFCWQTVQVIREMDENPTKWAERGYFGIWESERNAINEVQTISTISTSLTIVQNAGEGQQ